MRIVLVDVNASWRDTAREAKLGPFNVIAFLPLMLFLFSISWSTFAILILTLIALQVLEYFGFGPATFMRFFRSTIAGKRRLASPWWM